MCSAQYASFDMIFPEINTQNYFSPLDFSIKACERELPSLEVKVYNSELLLIACQNYVSSSYEG